MAALKEGTLSIWPESILIAFRRFSMYTLEGGRWRLLLCLITGRRSKNILGGGHEAVFRGFLGGYTWLAMGLLAHGMVFWKVWLILFNGGLDICWDFSWDEGRGGWNSVGGVGNVVGLDGLPFIICEAKLLVGVIIRSSNLYESECSLFHFLLQIDTAKEWLLLLQCLHLPIIATGLLLVGSSFLIVDPQCGELFCFPAFELTCDRNLLLLHHWMTRCSTEKEIGMKKRDTFQLPLPVIPPFPTASTPEELVEYCILWWEFVGLTLCQNQSPRTWVKNCSLDLTIIMLNYASVEYTGNYVVI